MSLDIERRIAVFTVGLSIVVAVADFAVAYQTLPRPFWIIIAGTAGLLFIYGLSSLLVTNARMAAQDRALQLVRRLYRTARRKPNFVIRTLRDEGEVLALERFDELYYGPSALPAGRLIEWWKAYHSGIYAAFNGNVIVAAIGIWPLTRTAYFELRNGRRSEADISPQSFCRIPKACVHWYAGGVSVDDKIRSTTVLHDLIRMAFIGLQETLSARTVNVLAVATSAPGTKLLRRSGFNPLKPKATPKDPYQRFIIEGIDLRELRRRISDLEK